MDDYGDTEQARGEHRWDAAVTTLAHDDVRIETEESDNRGDCAEKREEGIGDIPNRRVAPHLPRHHGDIRNAVFKKSFLVKRCRRQVIQLGLNEMLLANDILQRFGN